MCPCQALGTVCATRWLVLREDKLKGEWVQLRTVEYLGEGKYERDEKICLSQKKREGYGSCLADHPGGRTSVRVGQVLFDLVMPV